MLNKNLSVRLSQLVGNTIVFLISETLIDKESIK